MLKVSPSSLLSLVGPGSGPGRGSGLNPCPGPAKDPNFRPGCALRFTRASKRTSFASPQGRDNRAKGRITQSPHSAQAEHAASSPSVTGSDGSLTPTERLERLLKIIDTLIVAFKALPTPSSVYLSSLERFQCRAEDLLFSLEPYYLANHNGESRLVAHIGSPPHEDTIAEGDVTIPNPTSPTVNASETSDGEGQTGGGIMKEAILIHVDELEQAWWSSEVVAAWYGPRPRLRQQSQARVKARELDENPKGSLSTAALLHLQESITSDQQRPENEPPISQGEDDLLRSASRPRDVPSLWRKTSSTTSLLADRSSSWVSVFSDRDHARRLKPVGEIDESDPSSEIAPAMETADKSSVDSRSEKVNGEAGASASPRRNVSTRVKSARVRSEKQSRTVATTHMQPVRTLKRGDGSWVGVDDE